MRILRKMQLSCLAQYLRSTSLETARWRLEMLAIAEVRFLGAAMGSRVVRTRHGFRMELDLGDWVDQHIYATGDYEPYTARIMRELLRKGDRVLDVGANVGFFTLLASQCIGAAGCVTAFEPMPITRERLIRNVALNSCAGVMIREEAVGDVNGRSRIYPGPTEHSGIASMRQHGNVLAEGVEVETATLDSLLRDDERVALVKIDVEGAEMKVLREWSAPYIANDRRF